MFSENGKCAVEFSSIIVVYRDYNDSRNSSMRRDLPHRIFHEPLENHEKSYGILRDDQAGEK